MGSLVQRDCLGPLPAVEGRGPQSMPGLAYPRDRGNGHGSGQWMNGLDCGDESIRNDVKLISITVSTNEREWLSECFSSILRSDLRGLELVCVLVDNASTDGSAELVAERFPGVEIIRNDRKEGFSKANNRGM